MLSSKEYKALKDGHLTLDCPRIELKRMCETSPELLVGPGQISLTKDGLTFKMYTDSPDDVGLLRRLIGSPVRLGEVIPEDEYYSLLASDLAGRTWISSLIIDRCSLKEGGVEVSSDLREITHVSDIEWQAPGSSITYHVFHPMDFPANEVTSIYEQIGTDSKLRFIEGKLNRARFSDENFEFELVKHEIDHVEIRVSSERDALPPALHVRAIEALQFVLARDIRWTLMTKRSGKQMTIKIQPYPASNTNVKLRPPISRKAALLNPQATWDLYLVFLRHILRDESPDQYHPLSSWLNSVRAASSGTLNALCLALGVAIEGILKEEFSNEGEPSCEIKRAVEKLMDHIELWSGPRDIKNRARSMVAGIGTARAIDRLRSLQSRGLVTPGYVDAWKKLRNSSAHGDKLDLRNLNLMLGRCNAVVTLMYQLIYGAIGYEGDYTDYGIRGWPLKRYPQDVNQSFPNTDAVEEALDAPH